MPRMSKISPCLWFDDRAEEAANFYTSVFPNSKVLQVTRYGEAGKEIHRKTPGGVMTVVFSLDGQTFTALNGGPQFELNEALSLEIDCRDQKEVDYYWEKLTQGGDDSAQQCGWLKDKFGVSWQVVPHEMRELTGDPKSPGSERAIAAMMNMKKLDIAELKRAHAGEVER